MQISEKVRYVGVNDHKVDWFEGQYSVPNGMSYNSYVILDEKITVMDTVDAAFTQEWLTNLEKELDGRNPDYLVIQHMEPDHSAGIPAFLEKYPNAKVVSTAKGFQMMQQFFPAFSEKGIPGSDRQVVAENGGILELGQHKLQFLFAPMVHWPEVMMTYESSEKLLFSADGFGKFGALDVEEPWLDEARRYYIGIVGKYGAQVQAVLKKATELEINKICPLHGPVLEEDLPYYINCYQVWSSYQPESKGVVIAYASVYGNTKKAAELLQKKLQEKGTEKVILHDLAREDKAEVIAHAFQYDRLVLASLTYNGDVFPCMREFIAGLTERNYQNRKVGFMENSSWAPMAVKNMKGMLEKSKNLTYAETVVSIQSAVKEKNVEEIEKLAEELSSEE